MFGPWTGLISRNHRSVVGNGNQLKWCARPGPDCFLIVPSTLVCIIWCVVSIISKFGEACSPAQEDTVWRRTTLCTCNNTLWINHRVDADTGSVYPRCIDQNVKTFNELCEPGRFIGVCLSLEWGDWRLCRWPAGQGDTTKASVRACCQTLDKFQKTMLFLISCDLCLTCTVFPLSEYARCQAEVSRPGSPQLTADQCPEETRVPCTVLCR